MTRFEVVLMTVVAHESGDEDAIRAVDKLGDEGTREAAHAVMVRRAEREAERKAVMS